MDNILKSKKSFNHLVMVKLEFIADPLVPAPDWWLNHAKKVEKKFVGTRSKGAVWSRVVPISF